MEQALRVLAAGVVAYLAGSIPWAFVVVRVFWGQDIRTLGSGNTGATNVLRVFGVAPGIGVLLLDGAKGALGVWLATLLAPAQWGPSGTDWMGVLGAAASIAGHSFSPWIGFRGGKGVATTAGAVLVLAPRVWPLVLLVFLVTVGLSRIVSVGSIVIAVFFPVACRLLYPDRTALLLFALAACVFVLWRHRGNMKRIVQRQEPTISFRRRLWGRRPPGDDGSF